MRHHRDVRERRASTFLGRDEATQKRSASLFEEGTDASGDSDAKRVILERVPKLFRSLSLLGIVSTLGGCTVGPDFKRPEVPVPANWRARTDPHIATQAAADSRWWKEFNDPSLDRLVELAYRENLPLQIAGLRILEARAQLAVATGEQFPQQQKFVANGTGVGLSQTLADATNLNRNLFYYQMGFDVAWEMDFWGKYRRGVEAETASLFASVADYYSAIVSLTAEVARTYVVIRTYEVLIEQAEQNAKLQEGGLEIAESRFRNGATSELDVTQATSLLENTRASIPRLQIGLQQARNALSTLLGQTTSTPSTLC